MVFLALPDDEAARALAAALRAAAGVTLVPWRAALFAHQLQLPWSAYQRDSDVGLAQLVTGEELLSALRTLADDLYSAVAAGDGLIVDWSPAHADSVAVTAIRSVYPDALVVTRPDIAAALDPDARAGVLVDASPAAVLASLPTTRAAPGNAAVPTPSTLDDRLIVVLGCGRSGTTWLEDLLMAHPDIGGAPRTESWIFQQLRPLWTSYDVEIAPHVGPADLRRAMRRYCDTVLTAAGRRHRPQASFFVEKTPVHSYSLAMIHALYPDAWLVHVVRDGRDVARSISQVPFFEVPDAADAARLWSRVVSTVRGDAGNLPRYREIRYEALHADPVGTMAQTFEWLGVQTSGPLAGQIAAAAAERVSAHAGTAAPVGPQSWRVLPDRDIARVYRAIGRQLVRDGYTSWTDVWRWRLAGLWSARVRGAATSEAPPR